MGITILQKEYKYLGYMSRDTSWDISLYLMNGWLLMRAFVACLAVPVLVNINRHSWVDGSEDVIDSRDFERTLAKIASRLRKEFIERGPIETRVAVMGELIIIKYTAKHTYPESFMLKHMQTHPSQAYNDYKIKLGDAMKEEFNPVFAFMHLGLQIREIKIVYFSPDFSEQVTVMKMNMDVEVLLKNEEIRLS